MLTESLTRDRAWRLVSAIQEISVATTVEALRLSTVGAARELLFADGCTLAVLEHGRCAFVAEDSPRPLFLGARIPLEDTASGWVILNASMAVIPDVRTDERSADTYNSTFVRSTAIAPIRYGETMGALGVCWSRPHEPTDDELSALRAIADAAGAAMAHMYDRELLMNALRTRTTELEHAEEQLRDVALNDELTGLRTRHGFRMLAEHQLAMMRRQGIESSMVFIDLDGLAQINEDHGWDVGNEAIEELAQVIRANCRDTDVIGRVGPDEFAVLIVDPKGMESAIVRRLENDLATHNAAPNRTYRLSASIGIVDTWIADDLDRLLSEADHAMSREKRAKHEQL